MRIAVAREYLPEERRVALTPADVTRLREAGCDVVVQQDAGTAASYSDKAYRLAGANVVSHVAAESVDVLCHVRPVHPMLPSRMKAGSACVGMLGDDAAGDLRSAFADAGVHGYALDRLGQASDWTGLDAQGAQDVVWARAVARHALTHFDGTIGPVVIPGYVQPAAKVFIVGGDVIAIGVADMFRQLGARVTLADSTATVARLAAATGATFLELPHNTEAAREHVDPYIADADIVFVCGVHSGGDDLVGERTTSRMRSGSVVVRAARDEQGCNVHTRDLPSGGVVTLLTIGPDATLAKCASAVHSGIATTFIIQSIAAGRFEPHVTHPRVAAAVSVPQMSHDVDLRSEPTSQEASPA